MIFNIIFNLVGILIFLFIFWERLKEDYVTNQIFGIASIMLILLLVGRITADRFVPDYWFWVLLVSQTIAVLFGVYRFRVKIVEVFEATVAGYLPYLSIYFLGNSITGSKPSSLLGSFILASLAVLYFIINKRYKKFTWYKSGKLGFSGLFVVAILFLIRAIVALFWDGVLSFSDRYDLYFSLAVSVISIFILYRLGKRSI